MMAMNYFNSSIVPNSDIELDIWEETKTNNGGYTYTTHPKLASFLMKKGYTTELWHNKKEGFVNHNKLMNHWEFHRRMKYYKKFRAQAESEGMRVIIMKQLSPIY